MRSAAKAALATATALVIVSLAGAPPASAAEANDGWPVLIEAPDSDAFDMVLETEIVTSSTALSQSPHVEFRVGIAHNLYRPAAVYLDFVGNRGALIRVFLAATDRVGWTQYYSGSVQMSAGAPSGQWSISHVRALLDSGDGWIEETPAHDGIHFTDSIAGSPGANIQGISMSPHAGSSGRFSRLSLDVFLSKPAVAVSGQVRDPQGGIHSLEYRRSGDGDGWIGEIASNLTGVWEVITTETRFADGSAVALNSIAEFGEPSSVEVR